MLNNEVLDSLQKVNVNLVFYGDNVTISMQRDKTINLIYQTAYDYFTPHGKIKLYYKNKELTPHLNKTISKYFQKLKNIDILVKDSAKLESNINNQLLINVNSDDNSKLLLMSDKINQQKEKSNSSLPQNKRAMSLCWDCKKFPINIFCRDCCAFICKYCRMNIDNSHYSHRTITLYPENLAKSANLYKNVLIEDLNEVQKINKNVQKLEKDKNDININLDEYKNHLYEKVNRLINKIKQIQNYQKEINYHINNKNKYKEKINSAIEDVKTISEEYYDNIKGKGNDLRDIFTKMNNIEKNTQNICKIGKTIEEWEKINVKLEEVLKNAQNKICSIINEVSNLEMEENNINNNNINQNNIEQFKGETSQK